MDTPGFDYAALMYDNRMPGDRRPRRDRRLAPAKRLGDVCPRWCNPNDPCRECEEYINAKEKKS